MSKKKFEAYQNDPKIQQLIVKYYRLSRKLHVLKSKAKECRQVDDIIDVVQKKVNLHHQMWEHIYNEEDRREPIRYRRIWVFLGTLILLTSAANLAISLDLLPL